MHRITATDTTSVSNFIRTATSTCAEWVECCLCCGTCSSLVLSSSSFEFFTPASSVQKWKGQRDAPGAKKYFHHSAISRSWSMFNQRGMLETQAGWLVDLPTQINQSYSSCRIRRSTAFYSFETSKPYINGCNSSKKRKRHEAGVELTPIERGMMRSFASLSGHFKRIISIEDNIPNELLQKDTGELRSVKVEDIEGGSGEVILRNDQCSDRIVSRWGLKFILPPYCLSMQSRLGHRTFEMLLENRPRTGYQLITLDPPWQSKSVRRSKYYECFDHRVSLPLIPVPQLVDSSGAYVLIWVLHACAFVGEFLFLGCSPGIVSAYPHNLPNTPRKVTNDPKIRNFVVDELLPSWGLSYVTTWYWVKVTKQGEMCIPLTSVHAKHRKPYEQLIISKCNCACGKCRQDSSTTNCETLSLHDNPLNHFHTQSFHNHPELPSPPPHRLILCQPGSKLHSKKPLVGDLFRPFLPPWSLTNDAESVSDSNTTANQSNYQRPGKTGAPSLELFARSLTKGWHSWGNECLHFQRLEFYDGPF